jgi:CDP-glucose 4,6-dehydratase
MSTLISSERNKPFCKDKRIFLTGHTGFTGAWMTVVLHELGAEVMGYALEPEPECLFGKINGVLLINSIYADIRNSEQLKKEICTFKPEIVIHFAALVMTKDCFDAPKLAYETNVMGTVNLFEAIRECESVKSVLIVTTDKVYENKGDGSMYSETSPLWGGDPYSSSKTCMEFVSEAYKLSYLQTKERMVGVATVRASNIIGGGDHIKSRLIPTILNSFKERKPLVLRNPHQIRPWQSVLDALNGYLSIIRLMYEAPYKYSGVWNIGPFQEGMRSVLDLVTKMQFYFGNSTGYSLGESLGIRESRALGLDIKKAVDQLSWKPEMSFDQTVYDIVDFFKRQQSHEPELDICLNQIRRS